MAHSEPFLFAVVSSQDDFLQIPVGWKGRFNTCHGSWEAEAVGLKALCLPSHLWPCSKQGHAFPCPQAHPSPLQEFHRPGLFGWRGSSSPLVSVLYPTLLCVVLASGCSNPTLPMAHKACFILGPSIQRPNACPLKVHSPNCNKADVGVFLCLSLCLLQVGLKSW